MPETPQPITVESPFCQVTAETHRDAGAHLSILIRFGTHHGRELCQIRTTLEYLHNDKLTPREMALEMTRADARVPVGGFEALLEMIGRIRKGEEPPITEDRLAQRAIENARATKQAIVEEARQRAAQAQTARSAAPAAPVQGTQPPPDDRLDRLLDLTGRIAGKLENLETRVASLETPAAQPEADPATTPA